METPKLVQAKGSFLGGGQRTYTRALWYRQDEADFNANMHDEPLDRIPIRPMAELDEDPYAEGRELEMPAGPTEIEQLRKDFQDPLLAETIKKNWRIGEPVGKSAQALAAEEIRLRNEVRRAVIQAEQQQSLFDTNFARCVPDLYRKAFLTSPEAEQVCASLVPMLLTQSAVSECCQIHVTADQMRRIMYGAGCTLLAEESKVLRGHVQMHAPANENDLYASTYGAKNDESLHCHWNQADNTTAMRIMIFVMPPDNYRIRVVCHEVAANVLCFRTFQFMHPVAGIDAP